MVPEMRWFKLYSASKDNSSSIAILFKKNFVFQVNKIYEDQKGRFLLVNGTKDDKEVTFCNIYAPSGPQSLQDRTMFFGKLHEAISTFKPDNSAVILGGDFNCITDVNLDRSRTTMKIDSSAKRLKEAVNAFELKDIWRHQNPE